MHRSTRRIVLATVLVVIGSFLPAAAVSTQWTGEPWLGLAKVQTQTCAPGIDERAYTLSILNPDTVNPWSMSGDRGVWDFIPKTGLPLRLNWITEHNPPPASAMADSVKVFLRDPNTGAQIGSSFWQPNIPQTASGELFTIVHLDDNPMNEAYGTPRSGLFEMYAQLVGGADNGADTQGVAATGPNCGSGSYARGYVSSGLIKLYDNWNVANNTSWSAFKWTTTVNNTARVVDTQGSQGRLYTNGSSARATAKTTNMSDSEVTFTYRFHDRGSRSYFRPMLRASGAGGTSQMPNGYRLEFRSDSATVKLQGVQGGDSYPLDEFTHTMNTNAQKVRFRVVGSTVQAKVWAAGVAEPATWSLEATDPIVTGPGVFQLNHNYSSGAHTITVDDVVVDYEAPVFSGQSIWELPTCNSGLTGQIMEDAAGLDWHCDGIKWVFAGGIPTTPAGAPNAPCDYINDGQRLPGTLPGEIYECKFSELVQGMVWKLVFVDLIGD